MSENETLQDAEPVGTETSSIVRIAALLTTLTGVIALVVGAYLLGVAPGPSIFSNFMEARPRPIWPAAASLLFGGAWMCASIGMRKGKPWGEVLALTCAIPLAAMGLALCMSHDSPVGYLILSLPIAQGFALAAYREALREDREARIDH